MTRLDPPTAARFARLTLGHLGQEYPQKLDHVINGPEDLRSPAELHPRFTAASTGTVACTAGGRC